MLRGSESDREAREDPGGVIDPYDPRRSLVFSGLDRWMRLSTMSRTRSPCRSRSFIRFTISTYSTESREKCQSENLSKKLYLRNRFLFAE